MFQHGPGIAFWARGTHDISAHAWAQRPFCRHDISVTWASSITIRADYDGAELMKPWLSLELQAKLADGTRCYMEHPASRFLYGPISTACRYGEQSDRRMTSLITVIFLDHVIFLLLVIVVVIFALIHPGSDLYSSCFTTNNLLLSELV